MAGVPVPRGTAGGVASTSGSPRTLRRFGAHLGRGVGSTALLLALSAFSCEPPRWEVYPCDGAARVPLDVVIVLDSGAERIEPDAPGLAPAIRFDRQRDGAPVPHDLVVQDGLVLLYPDPPLEPDTAYDVRVDTDELGGGLWVGFLPSRGQSTFRTVAEGEAPRHPYRECPDDEGGG